MSGRRERRGGPEGPSLDRRQFLGGAGGVLHAFAASLSARRSQGSAAGSPASRLTLFLCGDVMTGRGIDQVLPRPGDPTLYESYVKDAGGYVELAERRNGPIPRSVGLGYIWGEALEELGRRRPDARIVNLETAVTRGGEPWPAKGIHYRMEPGNVGCLTAAAIDCCVLANNHVLDWGYGGLAETLSTLRQAGLGTAGAGRDLDEAAAPAIVEPPGKGRVIVLALGSPTAGVPERWAATAERPGVHLLPDLSDETARRLAALIDSRVGERERPGDVVVASIHWGSNWGYGVPASRRRFARRLVDITGADVVHGHSSHHPIGIEVYRDRPILYGCGDFVNDYEGIGGHEEYRSDLALSYHVTLDRLSGRLERLEMTPYRRRRFRLERASREDAAWLRQNLDREGRALGTRVVAGEGGGLELRWGGGAAEGQG